MSEGQSSLLAELAELRDENGGPPMNSRDMLADNRIKEIVVEYLSHRGEQPYRILRGGQALWETHIPAMRHALRAAAPAPAPDMRDALADMIGVYDSIASKLSDMGVGWNGFRGAHIDSISAKVQKARAALVPPPATDLDKPTLPLPLTSEQRLSTEAVMKEMRTALVYVRSLISEAALTGFNHADGDWATRLFESQHFTTKAIKAADALPYALPPAGDRDAVVEEIASNLESWYPEHKNINAYCAAVRSMKSINGGGNGAS